LKRIQYTSLFLLAILAITACSRKKDTFLNRNFHSVSTEYNTLFNGDNAFVQGKEGLAQTYTDNFYETLPVERIEVINDDGFDLDGKDPNFNKAEEKAVKAIQKHSMYIGGKEYNPQIDEAYMLLGKARYYDNRFIPALDAFNFILNKSATSNNVNNAKIWKAKTNIRLNNEEYAIENLLKMLEEENLEDEVIADANAMIAQAMINLDSMPQALPYMKTASKFVKDNELRGRFTYIKGQLYNKLDQKDSANFAFDEVIALHRKTARVYLINAHMAKAKNFNYNVGDQLAFLELLQDLEEDRENRPFLDKIYNGLGDYYRNTTNDSLAVIHYNKSIQSFKEDQTLQSLNYQTLAEMNFDEAQYKDAGAYYDSTLTNLVENTRQWRRVKKKRENLDDVIKYEDIATNNDSILRISEMSDSDKLAFFTRYTDKLRTKAVADSIAATKVADKSSRITNNEFLRKPAGSGPSASDGKFYFYTPSTVAYGKVAFRKVWGDRTLEDNWRRSKKKSTGFDQAEEIIMDTTPIAELEMFKPETYIAMIPTDAKVLDSLTKDRDFAYYQLGLIYKEKFKEYDLAINRLEILLENKPEARLVLPAKYTLYKIYRQLENETLAQQYKNEILNNHSDSRYAEILRNPNAQLASDASSPEFKYNALYKSFEGSKYAEVIRKSDAYITLYNGTEIVPKFELLKATAIARQDGFYAYKKALNFVSLTYPNSPEGKRAQLLYSTTIANLEFKNFVSDKESTKFKLVYPFSQKEAAEISDTKKQINDAIAYYKYQETMFVSVDYYNASTTLLVVHGLDSRLGAEGLGKVLSSPQKQAKKNNITPVIKAFVGISSDNYKIVQIHKNLEAYRSNSTQAPASSKPAAKDASVKKPAPNKKPDPIKKEALIEKQKRIKNAGSIKKETP
jgi:tetratricopeptide (TPR) repeat protein